MAKGKPARSSTMTARGRTTAKGRPAKSLAPAAKTADRVAYLGPEGTYTHAAVQMHFADGCVALPQSSIEDVFAAVQDDRADFGVVPVENSSEGAVNITLDRLMRASPPICGEIELPVHHNLLSQAAGLAGVKRVCAHPQALAQCRRWLDANLPAAEQLPVSSNAEGARRAQSEAGVGAIAGLVAAEVYGLSILSRNIEDEDDNTTRFLVLNRRRAKPTGADKTSILVSGSRAKAGSLFRLLEPLAKYKVNMTRIESRPSRRAKWDYVFFIDIAGHATDAPVAKALAALRERSSLYRVLGSYPRANP
jgi:chorismate mutase / prephenate dehydratase